MNLIFSILVLFFCIPSFSAFHVIGSSKDSTTVSKEELRKIYLGYLTKLQNGSRVQTVHLPLSNQAMKDFLQNVVGMDHQQFSKYWRIKLFSGRGYPPKEAISDSEVIQFIKNRGSGAIGIVSEAPTDSGVKVLEL